MDYSVVGIPVFKPIISIRILASVTTREYEVLKLIAIGTLHYEVLPIGAPEIMPNTRNLGSVKVC